MSIRLAPSLEERKEKEAQLEALRNKIFEASFE